MRRFEADVGLALIFLFHLTNVIFYDFISSGISQLLDPFINPGGAVIVLFQEIVDDLVVRDQNALFPLSLLVLGRLLRLNVLFNRVSMNTQFSGNGFFGKPLPM